MSLKGLHLNFIHGQTSGTIGGNKVILNQLIKVTSCDWASAKPRQTRLRQLYVSVIIVFLTQILAATFTIVIEMCPREKETDSGSVV